MPWTSTFQKAFQRAEEDPDPGVVLTPRVDIVDPDVALQHLRTLLDFNASILAAEEPHGFQGKGNEEADQAFQSLKVHASQQKDELEDIIEAWKRVRRPGPQLIRITNNLLSNRELIESWIEIKTTAVDMYRTAALNAPTSDLRKRLERLAEDEANLITVLRELL